MIHIYFNGQLQAMQPPHSLQALLIQKQQVASHFAVAVNQQLVPRSQYQTTPVCDGDRIDIIVPMQGG